jgi:GST-like protein
MRYAPEKIPYAIDRYTNEAKRLCRVADGRLADREFIAGEYSIADMAIWPWTRGYKGLGVDRAEFPNFHRWFKQVGARDAVRKGAEIGKADFARRQREIIKQEVSR